MTLCEHGCGTELNVRSGHLHERNQVHTPERCRDALRALLDEAEQSAQAFRDMNAEEILVMCAAMTAAGIRYSEPQNGDTIARHIRALGAKLAEAERERDEAKKQWGLWRDQAGDTLQQAQRSRERAERFRTALTSLRAELDDRPHGVFRDNLIADIDAALADPAPEAGSTKACCAEPVLRWDHNLCSRCGNEYAQGTAATEKEGP